MVVKINNKYQLRSDKINWILEVKTINKEKENCWNPIGYFNTPEYAVQYLADLKIRLIPDSDINKILKKIDKIRIELKKVFEPYEISVS